jgi:Arc/MetJ family transcription regulator
VLGNDCFVGDGAVVTSDVKVYPFKSIEAGAVVTSSILWETRRTRSVFGRRGASGIANVEITAELATRLAQAYGTSLKKGAVVTTSRDTSRRPRVEALGHRGLNSPASRQDVEPEVPLTLPGPDSQARRYHRAARSRRPARTEIRFFDSTADITSRCSASSSGSCTARTSAVRSPVRSAT